MSIDNDVRPLSVHSIELFAGRQPEFVDEPRQPLDARAHLDVVGGVGGVDELSLVEQRARLLEASSPKVFTGRINHRPCGVCALVLAGLDRGGCLVVEVWAGPQVALDPQPGRPESLPRRQRLQRPLGEVSRRGGGVEDLGWPVVATVGVGLVLDRAPQRCQFDRAEHRIGPRQTFGFGTAGRRADLAADFPRLHTVDEVVPSTDGDDGVLRAGAEFYRAGRAASCLSKISASCSRFC
ncbi:hypothetical protein [Nocardia camponoti]|uniref:hypothetical protein n=1 Tax=Nocardia camponoti TaxID=1616106 RepID=UPI001668A385|nr:hypothetical protein [Nocardia camponoti]